MAQRDLNQVALLPDSAQAHCVTELPVLVFHVHSSCNCRCVMCDIWKSREIRALEPKDLESHLTSIRQLRVRWVVFTGGEPLLNPAFADLCRLLREESVRITLLTTGLLLKKYAREVVDSFDDVIVSLDGPRDIHDAIRRIGGAFGLIEAGMVAIRAARPGFRVTARSTVQKANFRYLRQTVGAAKLLGLQGVSFLPVDVTSHAFNRTTIWPLERQNELALSLSDLHDLKCEIEGLIQENAEDIRSGFIAETPEKLWRILRHFRAHLGLEKPESPPCNAPWTSAVVETDGSVRPCFFHAPIGNIREGNLREEINSATAVQFRSTLDMRTNPVCNRCVCPLNYRW